MAKFDNIGTEKKNTYKGITPKGKGGRRFKNVNIDIARPLKRDANSYESEIPYYLLKFGINPSDYLADENTVNLTADDIKNWLKWNKTGLKSKDIESLFGDQAFVTTDDIKTALANYPDIKNVSDKDISDLVFDKRVNNDAVNSLASWIDAMGDDAAVNQYLKLVSNSKKDTADWLKDELKSGAESIKGTVSPSSWPMFSEYILPYITDADTDFAVRYDSHEDPNVNVALRSALSDANKKASKQVDREFKDLLKAYKLNDNLIMRDALAHMSGARSAADLRDQYTKERFDENKDFLLGKQYYKTRSGKKLAIDDPSVRESIGDYPVFRFQDYSSAGDIHSKDNKVLRNIPSVELKDGRYYPVDIKYGPEGKTLSWDDAKDFDGDLLNDPEFLKSIVSITPHGSSYTYNGDKINLPDVYGDVMKNAKNVAHYKWNPDIIFDDFGRPVIINQDGHLFETTNDQKFSNQFKDLLFGNKTDTLDKSLWKLINFTAPQYDARLHTVSDTSNYPVLNNLRTRAESFFNNYTENKNDNDTVAPDPTADKIAFLKSLALRRDASDNAEKLDRQFTKTLHKSKDAFHTGVDFADWYGKLYDSTLDAQNAHSSEPEYNKRSIEYEQVMNDVRNMIDRGETDKLEPFLRDYEPRGGGFTKAYELAEASDIDALYNLAKIGSINPDDERIKRLIRDPNTGKYVRTDLAVGQTTREMDENKIKNKYNKDVNERENAQNTGMDLLSWLNGNDEVVDASFIENMSKYFPDVAAMIKNGDNTDRVKIINNLTNEVAKLPLETILQLFTDSDKLPVNADPEVTQVVFNRIFGDAADKHESTDVKKKVEEFLRAMYEYNNTGTMAHGNMGNGFHQTGSQNTRIPDMMANNQIAKEPHDRQDPSVYEDLERERENNIKSEQIDAVRERSKLDELMGMLKGNKPSGVTYTQIRETPGTGKVSATQEVINFNKLDPELKKRTAPKPVQTEDSKPGIELTGNLANKIGDVEKDMTNDERDTFRNVIDGVNRRF